MMYKFFTSLFVVMALLLPAAWAADKPLSDDAIYDQVKRRLANDIVVKGGGLDVEVKDGVVTLAGVVERSIQKEKAEKITKKIKGVKQVVNNLRVTMK
ncbi:MAG: BON domain-containing protein [Candidatus Solibacter usitatus]|nr:BON domain-containing protein [Candidatus Solibacter usitatus]